MSTKVKRVDGGYATFPNRWVDAGYMAKAPGSVTQVYIFLCRWADNTSFATTQPMRLIAKKCGLSEDVARKAVRTLEAWNVIEREPESGPNAVNTWTLLSLMQQAPDYPDKVPPKLSGGPQSGGAESGGPYQPNSYQPDTHQPEDDKYPEIEKEFSVFWTIYPRREGKADARKAWTQVTQGMSLQEKADICSALGSQVSNNWRGKETKYIPMPATWLRGKRWEDEITPYTNGKGERPKPAYFDNKGGYTAEGLAAKARGEI